MERAYRKLVYFQIFVNNSVYHQVIDRMLDKRARRKLTDHLELRQQELIQLGVPFFPIIADSSHFLKTIK